MQYLDHEYYNKDIFLMEHNLLNKHMLTENIPVEWWNVDNLHSSYMMNHNPVVLRVQSMEYLLVLEQAMFFIRIHRSSTDQNLEYIDRNQWEHNRLNIDIDSRDKFSFHRLVFVDSHHWIDILLLRFVYLNCLFPRKSFYLSKKNFSITQLYLSRYSSGDRFALNILDE